MASDDEVGRDEEGVVLGVLLALLTEVAYMILMKVASSCLAVEMMGARVGDSRSNIGGHYGCFLRVEVVSSGSKEW